MTPAQRRALALGTELHTLNLIRAGRASLAAVADLPPSRYWPYRLETARIQGRIRAMRELLLDQLLAAEGPRHAAIGPVQRDRRTRLQAPYSGEHRA
jgi:hypothetical protein